ncbi:MAG: N-acetylmuramoyl-L-alanine amidase family protein [Acidobacteriota bacterium]
MRPVRRGFSAAVAGLLALCALAGAAPPKAVPTQQGRRAVVEGPVFLRVPLTAQGGLNAATVTFTGSAGNLAAVQKYNPVRKGRRLREARIPLSLLRPAYAREALIGLFPDDRRTAGGWEHVWATGPKGAQETWADLARWFTEGAKNAGAIEAANRAAGRRPRKGAKVLIPDGLLLPSIRALDAPAPPAGPGLPGSSGPESATPPDAPSEVAPSPGPEAAASGPEDRPAAAPVPTLEYGSDGEGPYALYRLQAGEALYSAVVVRFTGNVNAEDVNALAREVARRSGIADVTSIPVGFSVKIPLDDLLPQFLPPEDPRFRAWAENQAELKGVTNTYKSAVLDGVVVVLDPGHGGLDRGAMKHGVWEDSYVYDISCRIRETLERRTKARVLMTLLVPELGHRPQDKTRLSPNTTAVILTHPWFKQTSREETKVEVNLRWHLANQYFLRLQKEGVDPQRIVFTSVHADSLHPSLRGSMFYIPGDSYRSTRWCSSGPAYEKFEEFRAGRCYEATKKDLRRSEGLSLQFSRQLEAAFAARGLLLHPFNPTRDHVIRGKRSWVPAVLRNNLVPCSVLIEVCNLANPKDAALIADPAFRQRLAEAYVDALIRYYS